MASGLGGGIWKQTPGEVFTDPLGETTCQFSGSELDFRVNFSPLDREPCVMTMHKTHDQKFSSARLKMFVTLLFICSLNISQQFEVKGLHLICLPVTQGLHCDWSAGVGAPLLQRSDGGAASPQVCQHLFTVLYSLFLCLKGNRHRGKEILDMFISW